MERNTILLTDSYKYTHHKMYPDKLEYVYSYFESRRGAEQPYTKFFGLQYFLQQLAKPVTKEDLEEAKAFSDSHLGPGNFNEEMWTYIVEELDGKLPIEIKAVPEGSVIPTGNVLITVVNTDPKCAPLTNHIETWLSQVWYPCTVATKSYAVKEVLRKYYKQASSDDSFIDFALHDFGMRGVSSMESASIGGAAHLLNFKGTDTTAGIKFLQDHYNGGQAGNIGLSVPASEHSVMTISGPDGEFDVVERILEQYSNGIVSVVSDSYDILRAVEYYCTKLKDKILARNGKFVIRPDSGDPVSVILDCLKIIEENFNIKRSATGYKLLPEKLGLIWGDGVDLKDIVSILRNLIQSGWDPNNIVFGMGGGLLQKVNRDTQRFAFKASAACIDSTWVDVSKNPTDSTKKSKAGKLALIKTPGGYETVQAPHPDDLLETVFLNGEITKTYSYPL